MDNVFAAGGNCLCYRLQKPNELLNRKRRPLSTINGNRRAFLRGSFLNRQSRAQEKARQQPLGPPPPWHRDLQLDKYCINCAHPCITACEPAIIRLHPSEHEMAGLPYLDFSTSGCTFCQACVEACPIEIDASGTVLPDIGQAVVNHGTCIAWHEIICQSCIGICEFEAITSTYMRNPVVNSDLCNGCGMCVKFCPLDSLTIISASG